MRVRLARIDLDRGLESPDGFSDLTALQVH